MNINIARKCVKYVVDDALCARRLGADLHAIVRTEELGFKYPSRIIGWWESVGRSNPISVAVHSYLDVALTDAEATELATDYLVEIGFFAVNDNIAIAPDYVL